MRKQNSDYLKLKLKRLMVNIMMPLFSSSMAMNTFGNDLPLPCPEEQSAAKKTLQHLENNWPIRGSNDPVTQYIQHLGNRLTGDIPQGKAIKWHFMVVRNLSPNAFSIGDGYVFVTEGAINLAKNESELAAILAHELGHELSGHFCQPSQSFFSGDFFDIFSSESPTYRVDHGSITQTIDPAKERQADQVAIQILQHNAFNPHAILDISQRLPINESKYFNDYERIQFLEQSLKQLRNVPEKSSVAFYSIKQLITEQQK